MKHDGQARSSDSTTSRWREIKNINEKRGRELERGKMREAVGSSASEKHNRET